MKKLTKEQLSIIAYEVFYEMIPDYTDEDENSVRTQLVNIILTTITKFISKYQEEQEN